MKKIINILSVFTLLVTLVSCEKKDNFTVNNTAGLTVIHLAAGLDEFKVELKGGSATDERKPNEVRIGYFDNKVFGLPVSGPVNLNVYSLSNPQKSLYKSNSSFGNGECYSLIIAGNADQVDTLLLKDNIPARKDTTTGVRFINMLSTKQTIKVNISGRARGSELSNLPYRAGSSFLYYPAFAANTRYAFEITDAETGAVLKQISYTTARFRNVTYIITGFVDGSPGVDALRVNHY